MILGPSRNSTIAPSSFLFYVTSYQALRLCHVYILLNKTLPWISATPSFIAQREEEIGVAWYSQYEQNSSPHLFDHGFNFPLLAEHHVVQVFDPLAETRSLGLQISGPKAARRLNMDGAKKGLLIAFPGISHLSSILVKLILISLSEGISLKCFLYGSSFFYLLATLASVVSVSSNRWRCCSCSCSFIWS